MANIKCYERTPSRVHPDNVKSLKPPLLMASISSSEPTTTKTRFDLKMFVPRTKAKCNHLNLSYHHHRLTNQQQQQQLVLTNMRYSKQSQNFGGFAKPKKFESINQQNCLSEAYRSSTTFLMSLTL